MDTSENLNLPYIMPQQAQKHVTHNEAITKLDCLVQLSVKAADLNDPPLEPADGSRYLIGATPTGDWTARAGQLASWQDNAWQFHFPKTGWTAVLEPENLLLVHDGSDWIQPSFAGSIQNGEMVGIHATADVTNRLVVSSPASLFTHDGSDHRLAVNKALPADTASIIFQENHVGKVEIGTAGNSDLVIKTSPDGILWNTAMSADVATGLIDFPSRPMVKAALLQGWVSSAAGSSTGFAALQNAHGGFQLGDPLTNGPGNYLRVPESGIYHLILRLYCAHGSAFRASVTIASTGNVPVFIQTNESQLQDFTIEASAIVQFAGNDQLAIAFNNPAVCFHSFSHTELMLYRL